MARIRFGIIGSGGMAGRRAGNLAAREDSIVAAVAARNPDTGSALAREHGAALHDDWRQMVRSKDIDAVVIATHNAMHGAIAIAALDAGKAVFTEYPVARHVQECREIEERLNAGCPPLRATHNACVHAEHAALKVRIAGLGKLLATHFLRLTPGRGARPEVLFNIDLSGPPALFFVYHVHALVDLFGPARTVHCAAVYDTLRADTSYERFANTLTVKFAAGGSGQWTWAGGIEIHQAVQESRIVLTGGTCIETAEGWDIATRDGVTPLDFDEKDNVTLEDRFLADVAGSTDWAADARVAVEAARVGLAAEISAREDRVVPLSELR